MTKDNQKVFKDTQNYKIDIKSVYDNFIKSIDEIRSFVNINDPNNAKIFKNLKISDFGGIGRIFVSEKYQESRSHAFFRLIGFPVLSSSDTFYNPGHDIFSSSTKVNTIKQKLNIINSPKNGFYNFSNKKEEYYSNKVKNYFAKQDINATCLCLSSYRIRRFNNNIENYINPFDFNIENQSYLIKLEDANGVPFLLYEDVDAVKAENIFPKRYHFIFPLIIDPRIDLSASKRIAVPFLPDKSYLKVNDTYTAPRPILEKIIRERFDDSNKINNVGEYNKNLINFLNEFELIKSEDIVNKLSNSDLYGLSELEQFKKCINLIKAMMDELIQAQQNIEIVQSKTYWTPIPNIDGPEFGLVDPGVFIQSAKNLQTKLDSDIVLFKSKTILDTINNNMYYTKVKDEEEFSFDPFNQMVTDKAESLGNKAEEQLKILTNRRKVFTKLGEEALKTIEIIMGEFSGLGLCDIIAIITGLYLVDRKYLLGLLDDDAYFRSKALININDERPSIVDSITELQKKIFDIYNIMQKFYDDKMGQGFYS